MRRFLAITAAIAFAGGISLSTTAAATPSTSNEYCAVQVQPIDSGAPPAAPSCFTSQEGVDAFLGALVSKGSTSRAAAAATTTLLGTVYKDANYGGGSYTFYGTGSCAGATYGFPSLDASWQNTISSAKAFASCWVTLYDSASYAGQRYNCTPNCASVGVLNDRTKSIVFRPSGTLG